MQGMAGFDAYTAHPSMYEVHKFMALDPYEVGYFITQVGLAAASFGVADADVEAVGAALTKLFDYRCAPPAAAVEAQGPQLQSICVAEECPLAADAVCEQYEAVVDPMPAAAMSSNASASASATPAMNGSVTMAAPTSTATASGTDDASSSSATAIPTAAAVANAAFNLAAVAGGLAALLL